MASINGSNISVASINTGRITGMPIGYNAVCTGGSNMLCCNGRIVRSNGKELIVDGKKYKMGFEINKIGFSGDDLYVNDEKWEPPTTSKPMTIRKRTLQGLPASTFRVEGQTTTITRGKEFTCIAEGEFEDDSPISPEGFDAPLSEFDTKVTITVPDVWNGKLVISGSTTAQGVYGCEIHCHGPVTMKHCHLRYLRADDGGHLSDCTFEELSIDSNRESIFIDKCTVGEGIVSSTSGDVSIKDADGIALIRSTDGDVTVERMSNYNLSVVTTNGDVRLIDVKGEHIIAVTVNGDVSLSDCTGRMSVRTTNGDLTGRGPPVRFSTKHGGERYSTTEL